MFDNENIELEKIDTGRSYFALQADKITMKVNGRDGW
jgi:hypothetical protein